MLFSSFESLLLLHHLRNFIKGTTECISLASIRCRVVRHVYHFLCLCLCRTSMFWNTLELEFPYTDWHVCFLYGAFFPLPNAIVSLIFSLTEDAMHPGKWLVVQSNHMVIRTQEKQDLSCFSTYPGTDKVRIPAICFLNHAYAYRQSMEPRFIETDMWSWQKTPKSW